MIKSSATKVTILGGLILVAVPVGLQQVLHGGVRQRESLNVEDYDVHGLLYGQFTVQRIVVEAVQPVDDATDRSSSDIGIVDPFVEYFVVQALVNSTIRLEVRKGIFNNRIAPGDPVPEAADIVNFFGVFHLVPPVGILNCFLGFGQ